MKVLDNPVFPVRFRRDKLARKKPSLFLGCAKLVFQRLDLIYDLVTKELHTLG